MLLHVDTIRSGVAVWADLHSDFITGEELCGCWTDFVAGFCNPGNPLTWVCGYSAC